MAKKNLSGKKKTTALIGGTTLVLSLARILAMLGVSKKQAQKNGKKKDEWADY